MENNNQTTNETAQLSLFKKLMQKLTSPCHNRNPKIAKRLTALVVACGIALAPLTACDLFGTINPGITPGGTPGQTDNPPAPDGKKWACSEILQAVLTDPEYQALINQNEESKEWSPSTSDLPIYQRQKPNLFEAIPYGFLEDEGYDIEKIKNNELICDSFAYRIGKDLYVAVSAETKASTDYLTQYVLKYTLTDQELEDLDEVYTPYFGTKSVSYQAPFFIQELSYHKDPEVVSENCFTETCQNDFEEVLSEYSPTSDDYATIFLGKEYVTEEFARTYWNLIPLTKMENTIVYPSALFLFETIVPQGNFAQVNNDLIYQVLGYFSLGSKPFNRMNEREHQPVIMYDCRDATVKKLESSYMEEHFYK